MTTLVLFMIMPLAAASSAFTLNCGITSAEEQCLVVDGAQDGAGVELAGCSSALASGDGRDVFNFDGSGALKNSGGKCLNVARGGLVTGACSAQSPSFSVTPQGQLKVSSGADTYCVSQSGSFAGMEDIALHGPVSSTSDADDFHGASNANDGDEKTYWASGATGSANQELIIEFGGPRKVASFDIKWEAPAQAFDIQLTSDGSSWTTVYASDVNSLYETKGAVPYMTATAAKLSMHKPHPLYNARSRFGVKQISFSSPRLSTILEDCDTAATSKDARDKYFLSYVSEADCCPAKRVQALASAADAAAVSCAAAAAKLAERVGTLDHCVRSNSASFLRLNSAESELVEAPSTAGDDGSDVLQSTRSIISAARTKLAER